MKRRRAGDKTATETRSNGLPVFECMGVFCNALVAVLVAVSIAVLVAVSIAVSIAVLVAVLVAVLTAFKRIRKRHLKFASMVFN